MVTEVPTINELYGISLKTNIENLAHQNNNNPDEDAFTIAVLSLLDELKNKYSTKTLEYITNHYQQDMEKLEDQLNKLIETNTDKLFNNSQEVTMMEYSIPESKFQFVVNPHNTANIVETAKSSVKAMINQLIDDIRTKIHVWNDNVGKNTTDFSITPNFDRAKRRLKTNSAYVIRRAREHARRGIQKFVFRETQLYIWYCAGKNPCAWCIEQSKQAPRTIDEWETDHPYGYCQLITAGELQYRQEYLDLIGMVIL